MFSNKYSGDSYLLDVFEFREVHHQYLFMSNHPELSFERCKSSTISRLLIALAICLCSEIGWSQLLVWPGDANNDGIVNNLDLLNLGLGFGRQGNPRDTISITWRQWQVQPWTDSLPLGLNLGHAL